MSQYGDGEYCTVQTTNERVARKEHTCSACDEVIPVGQKYAAVFIVFDGEPYVYKRCARCQIIYEHLRARIRDEGDYDEFCDEQLACGHEYQKRWGEPPSEALAALAFWRPGDPLPAMKDLSTRVASGGDQQ